MAAVALTAALLAASLTYAQPMAAPRNGEPPELQGGAERSPPVERGAPDRAEREERPTARPAEPLVTPESQGDADPCAGDAACYQRRDLQAQEDMAKAAFWMTVATWVQVWVAVVGTILLLLALHYSREATKAATNTAKAAIKSNKINRDFMIADQRAWLSVKTAFASDLRWDEANNGSLDIEFEIHNYGKTPAQYVTIYRGIFDMTTARSGIEQMDKLLATNPHARNGPSIFPQNGIKVTYPIKFRFKNEIPVPWIIFVGGVVYQLTIDREIRRTKVHRFISREGALEPGYLMEKGISPATGDIPIADLRWIRSGSQPETLAE
jgi:hypothetical protein